MSAKRTLLMIVVAIGVAPALADAQQATGGAAAPVGQSASVQQPPPDPDEPSARRKGFIIGFGAGAGLHQTPSVPVFDRFGRVVSFAGGDNALAIATDFSVGYAPGDQLLLYYSNKVGFTTDTQVDAVAVTGFGVTYMFRRTSPTAFVNGTVGAGGAGSFIASSSSEVGAGYSIGGGYEFARHYSLTGEAMFVKLDGGRDHAVYRALFNFLFY